MNITKTQILSGDSKALQTLLTTCFIDVEAELSTSLGNIEAQQCLVVAQAFASGELSIDWQEQSSSHLQQTIKQYIPDISLASLAYIQFCYDTLLPYTRAMQLDAALLELQQSLRQRVFLQTLAEPDFWIKPHPLKNLTDFLYLAMLGWQPGFGQHSDTFSAIYSETIEQIEAIALDDVKAISALEKQTRQRFSEQQQFLDRFSKRMIDAETGKIKNRVSQLAAIKFINQITKTCPLPNNIIQFLQGPMLNELHLLLVAKGLDAEPWKEIQQLLKHLIDMYATETGLSEQHKQLPGLLQSFIDSNLTRSEKTDDLLNNIAFDISQLSSGKTLEGTTFAQAIALPEHLSNVEKHVSQQLVTNSKQFKENQWFLLRNEQGEPVRCKLLVKLEQYNQLIFSNFVGQCSLVSSYDDFAYLLSAKHLQPLSMYGGLTRCLHSKLDSLLDGFEQRFKQRADSLETLRQARLDAAAEQARRSAAEKAKAEAEAIAKRKAAAERKAKHEQLTSDLKRQARLSFDSLALGSWLEIKEADASYKRVKLAVKFNATGRFVFVDDNGITAMEAHRDDLVAMLLNGDIKQLETDKKFADRLAKIVADMRVSE